jgi:hypothetical protein
LLVRCNNSWASSLEVHGSRFAAPGSSIIMFGRAVTHFAPARVPTLPLFRDAGISEAAVMPLWVRTAPPGSCRIARGDRCGQQKRFDHHPEFLRLDGQR